MHSLKLEDGLWDYWLCKKISEFGSAAAGFETYVVQGYLN